MNRLVIHIVLLFFGYALLGQGSSIKAIGRATKEGVIKLRWAASDPLAWQYMNDYGVTIERVLILENGNVIEDRPSQILSREVKPAPPADWDPYIDEDDFVAISAQALYGESFEVDAGSSEMVRLMNQAKELENRFSFAMFAADHSIIAAELSGLFFEDQEVFAYQKYLYRIYANVPGDIYQIDTATVFIGLSDSYALPTPQDVEVSFSDLSAVISWNTGLLGEEFTSYWVERSDDGGNTFERISEKPFISTNNNEAGLDQRIYKVDSLSDNLTEYSYRVIGVDPFGELSTPSDTVSGSGLPDFSIVPNIKGHEIQRDGRVLINWEVSNSQIDLIKHFDVLRQNQIDGNVTPLKQGLDKSEFSFEDNSPMTTNYYIIKAVDIHGRETTSFPYLVQLEDSIPPAQPLNLQGSIDTLGRVYLNWDANTETDLYGYKVYRSNFSNGDYIQLDGPISLINSLMDSISLNSLTNSIYYQVTAIDNRYNESNRSEILMLSKPDIIPPLAPVFTNIQTDSLGILVNWAPSSSADVESQLLYRRSEAELDWVLIKSISTGDPNFYYDQEVNDNITYAYTMLSVDQSGIESNPTDPILIKWISNSKLSPISNLNYVIQREEGIVKISWEYDLNEASVFRIYKSDDGGKLSLLESTENLSVDMPFDGEPTEYSILAIAENGMMSGFKKVEVR